MLTSLAPFSRGVSARELGFGKEDDLAHIQCLDMGEPYTVGGPSLFGWSVRGL